MDVKMVRYAKERGVVDKKIAKFLMHKKKSADQKAAVINALGWDIDGKKNADIFLEFLTKKRCISSENPDWDLLNAHDLMCMGYLMAMDNYFDCEAAEKVLLAAREKAGNSYTIALVHSLVLAQVLFDTDWCLVWRAVEDVEKDESLVQEMNEEAVGIVFEYMSLYEGEC